jgi:hypothetical protein
MNAAALDTENDSKIDGNPFCFDARTTISAPTIALIGISQQLEEFVGAFVKPSAISPIIGWSCADRRASKDIIRGALTRIMIAPMVHGYTLAS